uniref:Uncharacterized protein n=1 Tax=Anguilla anguilla TaxID=7936 RepID=A0A0E9PYH8_ANGAN
MSPVLELTGLLSWEKMKKCCVCLTEVIG